jgi:predicted nucleic-acid-binding Zn-ribbon protein
MPATMPEQQNLPPERQCSRCQGDMIWANFRPDVSGQVSGVGMLFTRKRKDGSFGPHLNQSGCVALVCSNCGFTELYATQPQDLLKEEAPVSLPGYRPAPPPPAPTCARCGGPMQVVAFEGSDSGARIRFRKEWQASSRSEPQFTRSNCATRVCARCGYAEFYATTPGPLLGTDED